MHETRWRSLPHTIGHQQLLAVAGLVSVHLPLQYAVAADRKPRTALAVDEWPAIPVWPSWGGGRVVPMSFDPSVADPFLLLAHHKHSLSPGDPLRGPFKAVGGALGLPYVGDEGFAMHPHRGIDILTYVLDGSDGFRHRDSFGGECVYRDGAAQFMRSGRTAACSKCPRSQVQGALTHNSPYGHPPLQRPICSRPPAGARGGRPRRLGAEGRSLVPAPKYSSCSWFQRLMLTTDSGRSGGAMHEEYWETTAGGTRRPGNAIAPGPGLLGRTILAPGSWLLAPGSWLRCAAHLAVGR